MTKLKFILELNEKLSGLPKKDVEERLGFYSEMIDDKMEEGVSEEEAVSELGSIDDIAASIIEELSAPKAVSPMEKPSKKKESKEDKPPKRQMKTWEIVLLIAGAPVWLSLLLAAFSVVLSFYVTIWSVVISLWAVFVSCIGCAAGGIAGGAFVIMFDSVYSGVAMIGAGICLIGLAIFMFFICKLVTRGMVFFTKKTVIGVKKCFSHKEASK